MKNAEHNRLAEVRTQKVPWRKWGPYLSERQATRLTDHGRPKEILK